MNLASYRNTPVLRILNNLQLLNHFKLRQASTLSSLHKLFETESHLNKDLPAHNVACFNNSRCFGTRIENCSNQKRIIQKEKECLHSYFLNSNSFLHKPCKIKSTFQCHSKQRITDSLTLRHKTQIRQKHSSSKERRHPHDRQVSETLSDGLTNPVIDLQPFLQVPVFTQSEWVFQPSETEVLLSQALFKQNRSDKHFIELVRKAKHFQEFPESNLPEVAFLGRSNVGKSSLMRAVFSDALHNESKLYHYISVSKTPGHTTKLGFYTVGKKFTLVDMPGYGLNMPSHFVQLAETYLTHRQQLQMSFLLIDSESGITDVDRIGIEMMEEFSKPYVVVMTQIDKTTKTQLIRTLFDIKKYREQSMRCSFPQVFMVSSLSGEGIGFLRSFIAHITGCIPAQ